ncbi:MAG: branched-chain amino acid ABC transporter permease [Verrucomicrobiota bacterium]|nr:branched-chain amino acid ABC transporter permease [Verrucomicrobiota bacterium]
MKIFFQRNGLILCVIAVFVIVCPLLEKGMDGYWQQIAMSVGINAILAVSLTLINGITGQFSIGHAAFMAIGAYFSGFLSISFASRFMGILDSLPPVVANNLWILLVLLAGGILAGIFGFIVGMPTLRLRGDYLAITTLGFGEIVRVIILNRPALGAATGMSVRPNEVGLFWVYFMLLVCVVVIYRITHSPRGLSFSAIREDEIASSSIGIDPTRYKVAAFIVGAFFAGVGGALFAHQSISGYINPTSFGFVKSFEIIVMIVLGGLGSITGAILGAVVLTILPELLRSGSQYRIVIYALMLIILMLLRPQGLFGRHELSLLEIKRLWKLALSKFSCLTGRDKDQRREDK